MIFKSWFHLISQFLKVKLFPFIQTMWSFWSISAPGLLLPLLIIIIIVTIIIEKNESYHNHTLWEASKSKPRSKKCFAVPGAPWEMKWQGFWTTSLFSLCLFTDDKIKAFQSLTYRNHISKSIRDKALNSVTPDSCYYTFSPCFLWFVKGRKKERWIKL